MKATVNILAIILLITILAFPFIGWVKNIGKLASCDFQAPYKAEIIHGIGIVPIVGAFTGWMDLGK